MEYRYHLKKYISPEYWENVAALIEDLDLEFVGVTRIKSTKL